MIYKFADFIVEFPEVSPELRNYCRGYRVHDISPDIVLSLTQEDYLVWKKGGNQETWTGEFDCLFRYKKIADWLPNQNAFVFHASSFDVNGTGVAFAAHSGTGKTTHMLLWKEYLGDKMRIVNGDKPIVRFFPEEPETPYAYGTPWCGKEHYGSNTRTPLKHICFIERSETNWVETIDKKDAVNRIFNQVYMPKDPMAVMKTMELIDKTLSCCQLWIIHCNMEPDAAETAYRAIFGQ